MQAVLGIDVGPLAYWEIEHAYKAKLDHDLIRHAGLLAAIGNAPHYKPRRRQGYQPEDFYRPKIRHDQPAQRLTPAVLKSYKALFKKKK